MNNHPIEILGVTPLSHFPKCPPHHPCTQFCEIDKLCIPSPKNSMKNIRKVCFKVCINSFKVINTPAGKKLVIHGKKQIQIFFISDDPCHCIQSADFEVPFCTFVLLKEIHDEVAEICSVVEDISVKILDDKCLTITSIIFVCPIFEKDSKPCPCPSDHANKCHLHGNCHNADDDCHNKHQCTCHTPHDYHFHHDHQCQLHHTQHLCKKCQSSI